MIPHAERADYTVSFLANLFSRLFDLADFVAQLGRPLVFLARDGLFHFPPQPNQLGLLFGALAQNFGTLPTCRVSPWMFSNRGSSSSAKQM